MQQDQDKIKKRLTSIVLLTILRENERWKLNLSIATLRICPCFGPERAYCVSKRQVHINWLKLQKCFDGKAIHKIHDSNKWKGLKSVGSVSIFAVWINLKRSFFLFAFFLFPSLPALQNQEQGLSGTLQPTNSWRFKKKKLYHFWP